MTRKGWCSGILHRQSRRVGAEGLDQEIRLQVRGLRLPFFAPQTAWNGQENYEATAIASHSPKGVNTLLMTSKFMATAGL